MQPNVITIASGSTIEEAVEKMDKYDISCLPVTDKEIVIGIITRNDLAKHKK